MGHVWRKGGCILSKTMHFPTGPFRWVCTSGRPADLATTDAIALEVLQKIKAEYVTRGASGSGEAASYAERAVPQLEDNMLWIAEAEEHKLVVGPSVPALNTKGYSSTYPAMGFANVRAGTWYPPEH